MAARAIWKGVLRLGDVDVPVKLYSAVEDRSVHFRLLHADDSVPLKQRMVEPDGDDVPSDAIRRGFEVRSGEYVVLDDDELDRLEPESSRDIELTRFVPAGAIGNAWYDRPYWLGPDGDAGAYFALVAALREDEREGVARWTMRKREYQGSLRPEGEHLMLVTLRHADEVVPASSLPAPGGRALSRKEVAMAERLVEALADDWDPSAFRDEYRDRVLELIEAKSEGKTIPLRRPERKQPTDELERALADSLKAVGKRRKSA
ncbi:MAG: Ku protein [Longimicrobiales bacterium]